MPFYRKTLFQIGKNEGFLQVKEVLCVFVLQKSRTHNNLELSASIFEVMR